MNLRHLEVFSAVVECESFSGAAERLIMTQPAVSMQVQAVERHFGLQLLERRTRRVVLTEAGRAVYQWARQVLESEAETRRIVDQVRHAETGRIVIGSSTTVGSYVLPSILTRFKRSHPGAEIVVRLADRDEIYAEILASNVDCGVLTGTQVPPGLELQVLGGEEMTYICSPTHPLASRRRVSFTELADELFIMPPRGSTYRRTVDSVLATRGLEKVSVLMELDGPEGVKRGVQQGLGIGITMRSGVEFELQHGLLCEIAVPRPLPLVELSLVCRPRQHLSPMLQEFLEYLRAELHETLHQSSGNGRMHRDGRPGAAAGRPARRLADHR